jgi:hypothetical protein
MALLLEAGQQLISDQTAQGLLGSRDRRASSLVTCPLALCTMACQDLVGQQGRKKANQMPVCHSHTIGAILVVPSPSYCFPSFTHSSTIQRCSYVWIRPAVDSSKVTLTRPNTFLAVPVRERDR